MTLNTPNNTDNGQHVKIPLENKIPTIILYSLAIRKINRLKLKAFK